VSLKLHLLTSSQIRFLGDPTGKFTGALDLAFDGSAIFGGPRSKRYAMEVEGGKVKSLHVEPDNTGLDGMPHLWFHIDSGYNAYIH